MKVTIQLTEDDLKELVQKEISSKLGMSISINQVRIEVKTKTNYKAEWENGNFRATYEGFQKATED